MRAIKIGVILIALILVWFAVWYVLMQPHVARVKASLAYQDKRWQTLISRREPPQISILKFPMKLEVESIRAHGFPFKFQVEVIKPRLSITEFGETFVVAVPRVLLEPTDRALGTYRVTASPQIEAEYRLKDGPDEHYQVAVEGMPQLNLSARDSKILCGPMTGEVCQPVAADAPLISYAYGFPASTVVLHITLNNETRDATFHLPAINIPVYQEIPDDISRIQELFVNVLREVMVFKAPVTDETIEAL